MQITIDIPEDLALVAARRGLTPEGYAEQLLSEKLLEQTERMKKVERFLAEFPRADLPVLPESSYSRESIYSDDE